ncbi:MAG: helix-turn-helix transcriptional regulator [Usitatibacteraceae bacterium]
MRRKGERPVPQRLIVPQASTPVVRTIAQGDPWFQAWSVQQCTPTSRLVRLTGINSGRLRAIEQGDRMTRKELEALAMAWSVAPSDLLRTIPDPSEIID